MFTPVTLLRDGRLLAVGGRGEDGATTGAGSVQAFVYDAGHTATGEAVDPHTGVPTGRAVVVHGRSDYTRRVSNHHPTTLGRGHLFGNAVRLRDGRVVVVGGHVFRRKTNRSRVPDPPTGDELVAYDAVTGSEIDRAPLGSSVGAAYFFPHPDGRRLGLHVAMGQDAPLSHLAWLIDGRIQGRDLPGAFVNGFTSNGDRYLALPHSDVPEISVRDVSTGAIVVACGPTEIPDYNAVSDYRLTEAGALISDDFALVAVNTAADAGGFENHLLLSSRSLRWQADVDYGLDMTRNAIAATDGQGRWLTRGPDATVRLWQLPDRITDEISGQLDLW